MGKGVQAESLTVGGTMEEIAVQHDLPVQQQLSSRLLHARDGIFSSEEHGEILRRRNGIILVEREMAVRDLMPALRGEGEARWSRHRRLARGEIDGETRH